MKTKSILRTSDIPGGGSPGPTGPTGPTGPAGPVGASDQSPYLSPPTSPDAWDLDASLMTDPDLAANGWTMTLSNSPYTVFTRSGAYDVTAVVAPSTYLSSLRGGALLIRLPTALPTEVIIYKATSGNHTYRSHVCNSTHVSPDTHLCFVSDEATPDSATASSYFSGINAGISLEGSFSGGAFTPWDTSALSNDALYDQIVYLTHHDGSTVGSVRMVAPGGQQVRAKTTRNVAISAAYAGVYLATAGGVNSYSVASLYEIRRLPLNTFP